MAQAVERIIGSDEVRSSILRSSTWRSLRLRARGIFLDEERSFASLRMTPGAQDDTGRSG